MKKVLIYALACIALVISSCNQNSPAPAPAPAAPAPTPVTCQNSTWKYEVILSTPVQSGALQVYYADEYNNIIIDTTITSTWTKTLGAPFNANPTFVVGVTIGPNVFSYIPAGTSLNNTVKLNIYKNGAIVETTGVPVTFCQQGPGGPSCVTGSDNYRQISYVCL